MNRVEMDRDIFFHEVKQTAIFSCIEDADLMQIIDLSISGRNFSKRVRN